jgi:hypothetical protein
LHTFIIGDARTAAAQSRMRSNDQLELDSLNKYSLSKCQPNDIRGEADWPMAGKGRVECSNEGIGADLGDQLPMIARAGLDGAAEEIGDRLVVLYFRQWLNGCPHVRNAEGDCASRP